jgi:hypothetical protein
MQLSALGSFPGPSYAATPLQETAYQSHEKLDVSYQDASGRAFNLSIETDVSYYSATYDRSGSLGNRPDSLHRDLLQARGDADGAVRGFRRHLHRLLRAVDRERGDSASGAPPQKSVEVSAVSASVAIRMDVVDPEYWSVDNTAGRLKDFALSLYGGGDRQAHVDRMTKAMEEGYRQAAGAFGGKLPEIARQTLDAAQKMLSDWAKGGQADAPPSAPTQQLDLAA